MDKINKLKILLLEIKRDKDLEQSLDRSFSFDYYGSVEDFYDSLLIEMSGLDLIDFILEYLTRAREDKIKKMMTTPWCDLTDEQKEHLIERHNS